MHNYNIRKRLLVTGGAGFLGSHLCERLLERGDDVLCVDTTSPAPRTTSSTYWTTLTSNSSATT